MTQTLLHYVLLGFADHVGEVEHERSSPEVSRELAADALHGYSGEQRHFRLIGDRLASVKVAYLVSLH